MTLDSSQIKDVEKAALVQRVQLDSLQGNLAEMSRHADKLVGQSFCQASNLDDAEARMKELFALAGIERPADDELDKITIHSSLMLNQKEEEQVERAADGLDFTSKLLTSSDDWNVYMQEVESYALENHIDLRRDPFDSLLSQQQRLDLKKHIEEDFDQNSGCDKWDYIIAASCGTLSGFIDVFFVGMPGASKLGNITDDAAKKLVAQFAELSGWKGPKGDSDPTRSAIGFLERIFKVNYDQRHNGDVDNLFSMSASNHHLKSLAHSPSPIGLFFSILNQFTNTSTFVGDGQLITINTQTFELQGSGALGKIFSGFCNWIGHIMSDCAGASGSANRGSGVPIPFFELFQFAEVGNIGEEKKTIAEISVKIFEKGYDARFGAAMAVPVLVNELLIRVTWVLKRRYYQKMNWKECLPSTTQPSLRRMLVVGYGCLCLVDLGDAALKSGGEPVQMLLRMNLVAWTRFAFLGVKEAYLVLNKDQIKYELIENKLTADLNLMLIESRKL